MTWDSGIYEIVYCVSSMVGTYVLYRFMRVWFNEVRTNRLIEFVSYLSYYVLSTVVYLMIHIPMIMVCFNLGAFLLISLNYKADIKRRLFSILFIYIVMLLIEVLVSVFTGYVNVEINIKNNYSSILGIVCNPLLSLVVVVLLSNVKEIKKGVSIPGIYWVCLTIVPLFSVYFIILLFGNNYISNMNMAVCIISLLSINIAISYMYDFVTKSIADRTEKILLEQQNKSYRQQFEIMQASLLATKSLKHDLKNHFISLEHMLTKNENEMAKKYVESILNEKISIKGIHSGNIAVDSILGFKLQNAEKEGVQISSNFYVPEKISVASEDMVIILGNIIDNAIEAVKKIPESERWIHIDMKYDRNRLLIKVSNAFDGNIKKKLGKITTTKEDKKNHGIGLYNIRKAIEKYNGWMEMKNEDNVFTIFIGLYLDD